MAGFLSRFRRRREDELAQVDAEITAFGEALARCEFPPDADEAALADYGRALDAYERAKRDFVGDRNREDAADVLRALDAGRQALARAEARAAGRPLPEQRPLCFFDPRHGPSVTEHLWTPPEGVRRLVPVCAADAARLSDGLAPIATGRAPRPPATPATAPDGDWRPYKTCPPGTPPAQRAGGTGEREVELRRPDPAAPALLVIRARNHGKVHLVDGAGRRTLAMEHHLERTVLPLPVDGAESVRVRVEKAGPWEMWVQSLEHVPVLERTLAFKGPYVFRHDGGPAPFRFSHRGSGSCWIERLTDVLMPGVRQVSGKGSCDLRGELPGPGLYRVRTNQDWTLTLG